MLELGGLLFGSSALFQRLHSLQGRSVPDQPTEEKAKRGRRRPDSFATVTMQVRDWFEAEPWRTSRELFERLQCEQPGSVRPDDLDAAAMPKGVARAGSHRLLL
jgi:hypothetical protein